MYSLFKCFLEIGLFINCEKEFFMGNHKICQPSSVYKGLALKV